MTKSGHHQDMGKGILILLLSITLPVDSYALNRSESPDEARFKVKVAPAAGLVLGLGIGQYMQGRYLKGGGWAYTLVDVAAISHYAGGYNQSCAATDDDCADSRSKRMQEGVTLLAASHVVQMLDLFFFKGWSSGTPARVYIVPQEDGDVALGWTTGF